MLSLYLQSHLAVRLWDKSLKNLAPQFLAGVPRSKIV